ncbi:MAG: protease complex subunit PrcB family protein [Chitinophagaceae bacterium]|nr:protease complex subunit PrcB family protein [Chitinophagaceae bacterium]
MRHYYTLLFTAFACIIGCKKNNIPESQKVKNDTIKIITIGKGDLSGNGDEGILKSNIVISNEDDWLKLLKKIDVSSDVSSTFSESKIDFRAYTIIAAFDNIKISGGYSIEISDLSVFDAKKLIVKLKRADNGPGRISSVITQPFHIVKIPHWEKPIVFEE